MPTEARELARSLAPAAFAALKKALNRPGERVSAAQAILDRAYGKPQQSVNVRVIKSISELSDDELRAIAGETEHQLTIEHDDTDASPAGEAAGSAGVEVDPAIAASSKGRARR